VKQYEYFEGKQATENFEQGMKALFKARKEKVAKAVAKRQKAQPSELRKSKRSDKD
jgi:hypothetical protein